MTRRKLADGLFLECCKDTATKYPDIEFNSIIIDNAAMQVVSNPWQFDVMVMPNLYGNILGKNVLMKTSAELMVRHNY